MRRARWNHNLHYRQIVLDAMPARCERALDVGCGEGDLARTLRRSVPHVTAIDGNEACLRVARTRDRDSDIEYLLGDFRAFPFEPASFDFVTCVAALHHMDEEAALRRMGSLLHPGGALAVLGLARARWPADLPRDIAAVIVNRAHLAAKRHWESSAPTVWPPPHTYEEVQRLAERALGGVRFRRHLLWRYSLVWTKPGA